jgi:hypothetical protein
MRITSRRRAAASSAALALAGMAMLTIPASAASAAPSQYFGQYVCSSGVLEPGAYSSIVVTGLCNLTAFGTVVDLGVFRVAHEGTFLGMTGGQLVVDGKFSTGTNSVTQLGGPGSDDVLMGDVYSDHSLEMDFQDVRVLGDYTVYSADQDYPDNTSCSMTDPNGYPDIMSFGNGSVRGNFVYDGVLTCRMNLSRSRIGGNASVLANKTNVHTPGLGSKSLVVEGNYIGGKLVCNNNVPSPSLGVTGGKPNHAAMGKFGQCAHL